MRKINFSGEITPAEVARELSLGGSIDLCCKAAGQEPKAVQAALHMDKAQFSRWTSGQEGVVWPKLAGLMDYCGNDAPVLWMAHARGYDLYSLRKTHTETEIENCRLREENAALRRVLQGGR